MRIVRILSHNLSYRYTCTKCLYKVIYYSIICKSKVFEIAFKEGTVTEIMVLSYNGIFGSFKKIVGCSLHSDMEKYHRSIR